MYSVLLVDDEFHAIRGLEAGVQWDRLRIEDVFTASSLKQAQEIYRMRSVDVMVCDIEMPQGSGLQLLEWVRENSPRTETVFLTCHSDFAYAKQAIHLGSFDYLLKPVDYSELEAVVGKALEKVKKDRELSTFEETYKHYQRLWESHQPLVQEKFWLNLLRREFPAVPERINEQLTQLALPYQYSDRFLPVTISVHRWHKDLTERDERIMEYALRNAAKEEIGGNDPNTPIISLRDRTLLLILPAEQAGSAALLKERCDALIAFSNKHLYCDLCCYIGKPTEIQHLGENVAALIEMDVDNVALTNATLVLEEARKSAESYEPAPMNEWAEMLKSGAKDRLIEDTLRFLEGWIHDPHKANAKALQLFYQDFLQMIFFVLQSKGIQSNQVFADGLFTGKPGHAPRSFIDLPDRIRSMIELVHDFIHAAEGNLTLVEKVKRIVAASIGEQSLTREDIANQVFLNPDYLTRVFKKETGLSISDYLQQQRIEYAKELLRNTEQSISDIAVQVGYSNLSYFSTLFKKAVGVNPGEYRRRQPTN